MFTRRTAASRVTSLASVLLPGLVVLVVLAAVGCGAAASSTSPDSSASSTSSASPSSPSSSGSGAIAVVPGHPSCTGWPARVTSGSLPASFRPVAVIRCATGYQTIPGRGEWLAATLQRADEDLTTLTSALRRPPGRVIPGTICPALAMALPQIVLISGDGSMLSPKIPLDGCGMVQQQVIAALAALPWQTVSVRLLSQVASQREVATGCAPEKVDPFATFGSAPPSPGGAAFTAPPTSLLTCLYLPLPRGI
jgi:hypothetical protein